MKTRMMTLSAMALACWIAPFAHADRPATPAEREAMGIDNPSQQVWVREVGKATLDEPRAVNGANFQWQTRIGTAFNGRTGDFNFYTTPSSLVCASGSERFATATFDLADGARIFYVDAYAYDNSASEDMLVFLFSACASLAQGDNPPIITQLDSTQTSGAPGATMVTMNLSAAPIVVNSYDCKYMVRVNMASASGNCIGTNMALDKARIEYQRFQDQ